MGFIKDTIDKWKAKREESRKIDAIMKEAYLESMEDEAKRMGVTKAKIDSDNRISNYKKKIKQQNEKRELQNQGGTVDVFGLHGKGNGEKTFSLIDRK